MRAPAIISLGTPSTWGAPLADFPGFCGYSGDTGDFPGFFVVILEGMWLKWSPNFLGICSILRNHARFSFGQLPHLLGFRSILRDPAKIVLGIPSILGASSADFPGFCGYSSDTGGHVAWMVPNFLGICGILRDHARISCG